MYFWNNETLKNKYLRRQLFCLNFCPKKDAILVSSKILIICKIRWFVNVKNSMRTSFHWIWWYKMSVIVIDTFVLIQGHKYHTHNCQDLFCFYKTIFCDEICNLMNVYQIALSKLWYKNRPDCFVFFWWLIKCLFMSSNKKDYCYYINNTKEIFLKINFSQSSFDGIHEQNYLGQQIKIVYIQ